MILDYFVLFIFILNFLTCLYILLRRNSFKNNNLSFYANITTSFVIMLLGIAFYKGPNDGYVVFFVAPAFINTIVIMALGRNKLLKDILFSIINIVICSVSIMLYWDYMDNPWFSKGPNFINGEPQFGWFSFENNLYGYETPIIGILSVLVGLALRFIIIMLSKMQTKEA